jgi:hypothetical protein
MFLQNFHIFINKRAKLRQKITVQVTTLPDCDDITRFDGIQLIYIQCLHDAILQVYRMNTCLTFHFYCFPFLFQKTR